MVSINPEKAWWDREIPDPLSKTHRLYLLLEVIQQLDLWFVKLQLVGELKNTINYVSMQKHEP